MLGPWTQIEHRNKLGAGVDGQPEPQDLLGVVRPGAQSIQLEVRELEMKEEALVQGLSVLTCAPEPGGDGGLSVDKTRSAAEGSSPSASAENTMAT